MGATIKLPLRTEEIKQIIPHREPFLFVDEVIEFVDGERIVGLKHVRAEEPQFAGHFPGRPIMPGVLIIEALAQLGVIYSRLCTGGVDPSRLVVFAGCEETRFRKQVVPGDTVRLEIEYLKHRGPFWRMKGTARVGDELAAEGILTAAVT